MSDSNTTLPRWDMSTVYSGVESPDLESDSREIAEAVDALIANFDESGITRLESDTVDDATVATFEEVVNGLNGLFERVGTFLTYLSCLVSADSRDEAAQAKRSGFQLQIVKLTQLGRRFTEWIGSLDVDALIAHSDIARDHTFVLHKAKQEAEHLMSSEEEELAAELNITGGSAWSKLYHTFSSQLSVSVELEGQTQELPISAVRNLAYEEDREIRRRAYEAELDAWDKAAVPIAASLNSIKGLVNTLSRRRGWDSPLDAALFGNNMDHTILDAMMEAARERFPDFRRYLNTKARALGLERLAWYDLFASLGKEQREWSYDEAKEFIAEQFGAYSDRLRRLAERAFRENWIDVESRPGKSDGAFCALLRGEESRILMNFKPAFSQVNTLAHELGHAYHNLNLAKRTRLQRDTPMPLAETASTFCETIIQKAVLADAQGAEKLAILETSLRGACQVVLDITSRFIFEQTVFEKRQERELAAAELKDIMLEAQRATYGDALDPAALHPYMWAAKPHYYSTGASYYNFPYMFGMLFGLGLYARYQDAPAEFRAGYDDLLSSTGIASPTDLGLRFGIDIRTPEFWSASLDVIRTDIEAFEELV